MAPCEGAPAKGETGWAWTRMGLGYEWAWACAGVGASDLGGVILNERESERKRA